MLLSRGATIFRNACRLNERKPFTISVKQAHSESPWGYRGIPGETQRYWLIMAELCGGVMWWWVFWNLYHDYHHITGIFPYPRPVEWSDEELGIPQDY